MFKKSNAVPYAVAVVLGSLCAGTALAGSLPAPTVGGKLYVDFTNIDMTSDGTKTAASGTGFDVKRFYLSFSEKFDDTWSANVTTDATYNKGEQTDVYIKTAFVQATLSKAFYAQLGSANMPWIPFDEGLYGYRYVENTLIDRLHFGNSADWGLHVGGDLADGTVSYAVAAVNGNGYKNPSRSKSIDAAGRVSFVPVSGVTLAVGGYSGKEGKDVYGTTTTTYHTANRVDALAAYVGNGARVGVEYFTANDWNTVTKSASDKSDGYSAWASYDFTPLFGVFGRYDQAKTSKDLAPSLKDQYYNVGFAVHPRKDIDFALVYKHEKVDGGIAGDDFVNTSYGNVGGLTEGKVDEVGIWGQIVF